MKKLNSFLSMILCLSMLLSTLPMSVFAVDTTSRTTDSIEINVGEIKTIECEDGNIVYVLFKPTISGVYTFYSISNSDTYGYLYDSSKTQITQNDDDGEGRNFSITYDLIGGNEYYWGAKFYSSSAFGTIEIALTCDHEHINTVDDGGKAATCTEDGYTAGIYCNDCNKWLYGHEEIKASHTDVNEDKICDICGNNVPIATGTAGSNIIWNLYSSGHLELLGFGSMTNYKDGSYRYGHSPWYSYSDDITSITIQEGITSIGNAAFYSCDIESITIPDSVLTIGINAFEYCVFLKEIDFGNGVTTIGSDAFYKCTALTSVVLPDSVATIDGSFNFCENLRTVSFGKGLKTIGSLSFQHCALEYLSLPASVTTIDEHAFVYCYNLMSISVDKDNQYFSSDEYGALFNKDKTKLIKYPVGNRREYYAIPEGVTSIEYQAFMGSGGISSIIIGGGENPDIDVEEFEECSVLKEIIIPDSVQSIAESAFEYCALLQDITIPKAVTDIGDYAFYGCDSLKNITLPESVKNIGEYAFSSCDNLVNISLSNSVSNIGKYAFSNNKSLTDIIIPNSITTISGYTFYRCGSLTKIVIPKSVTNIYGYAFYGCDALSDVYYAGAEEDWNLINITKLDSTRNYQVNKPLFDATIHYNYNEAEADKEDDVVVSKLKYGADRLSFGVNITGYVGDVIDSLVVYTSANENIASLDITSSNADVVEIGTIKIGVGDYITTSENEHIATIPLKLKAEGMSTITITSPEGVSESVIVTVSKKPEAKKSIAIFTTEKSLSVNTGDSMWLAFGLMDESSGLIDDDWKKMAVVVSDPTIISLSEYEKTEYGYALNIAGKKEGSTNVTISDTATGISTSIVISVYDKYIKSYSYSMHEVNEFYPNNKLEYNIKTNIYNLNGLYVNNYCCTPIYNSTGTSVGNVGETPKEFQVTFDAYNSRYYNGAVDIYDADGVWIGSEYIDRYSDITSIRDTGEQLFFLISDVITGEIFTYEQASFSKKTSINIKVPNGGYFTISNNMSESPGTFFVNAFEILYDTTSDLIDFATSKSTDKTTFDKFYKEATKSFAQNVIDARNESLSGEAKKMAMEVALNSLKSEIEKIQKKFIKSEAKDFVINGTEMYSDISTLAENVLNSYSVNWKHLYQSATGVGESMFIKFSGPAGVALKSMFAITKASNKLLMAAQMSRSLNNTYATFYSSIDEGYINPHGIVVNTNGNVDSEAVLQVFKVSDNDTLDVVLNSDNPLEKYELYNICFVKDDKFVQPNGKVKVYVPIPNGMNGNTCKIYRQETDGSWTILDAHIEDNYLVFETDHFSLYTVIGDIINLSISSLPNKVSYREGDVLDISGLSLRLNDQVITQGFICEPTVLSGIGQQTITVKYGCASAEFTVNVSASDSYNIIGDVNGDDSVDSDDAIYLLYYTLLPDDYPINQSGDFNGDGEVNSDDAIYLLYHTLLPDSYPLK